MEVVRAAGGRTFGPYEIRGLLGHGGGGEVYRAWDPRLEREVALKVLRGRHERDPDRVKRFVAEARAASALNHPNILTVFDAAVDGDTPYIVSELIDGKSLRAEIRGGPLPLKRLLDLATQIADGLAAAHDASIVHRDLKPENILVTRTGRAKIVDFGLARPGGFRLYGPSPIPLEDTTLTESGLLTGTVPYMSPEQARGLETDFHSDQFSFGLIVHEMASGRNPLRRDTPAATLDAIINDELPPLAVHESRLPLFLRWIIERCLAKEPFERYAATADLFRDLRLLRDRTTEALSHGATATAESKARRRRAAFGVAAAGAMIALAAAVIVTGTIDGRPPFDSSALRFTPFATESVYEGFPAVSPDGQTIAYAAEVDGVLQIFTRRLTSAAAAQLTSAAYDCKHPFWSGDGKRIYYVSRMRDREGIWFVAAASGQPQAWLENTSRAAISPDGRTVAFLRDEERAGIVGTASLWISTPPSGQLTSETIERAKRKYERLGDLRFTEATIAFSPDGRTLGLSAVPLSLDLPAEARGWQFWMIPLPDGAPVRRLRSWPEALPRVSNFGWLDDGRHIVLSIVSPSTPGADLWIADLDRDRAWALTRSPDSEYYPSVSADGTIVFTKDEGDYDLVEVSDRGRSISLLATSRNEAEAVWSPSDPDVFAYVTDRGGQDEIWLQSRAGRLLRPLVTQAEFGEDRTTLLSAPVFAPDGQRIAYQRNGSRPVWPLRVWYSQVAGGPAVELIPAARDGYHGAPTWSPDGQWIAFAEWKDARWTLIKVRVGSNEPPVELRKDGVANATPRWSPRNDWITWETADALLLVSADGERELVLTREQLLVHEWARDGSAIVGVRQTEDLRLSLERIDVPGGQIRVLADLGPSAPVNHPVRGLSVSADGAVATALFRLRGDLWLLHGLRIERKWSDRFWPFQSP